MKAPSSALCPETTRLRVPGVAILAAVLALLVVPTAPAATEAVQGALELNSSVIAGGATRGSAPGGWSLDGTAGQVDAMLGTAAGGLTLDGGFWPIATAAPSEVLFRDGFE